MKRIFIILFAAAFSIGVKAQEAIKWHTLSEAIELNQQEPRKFVIDVYTDWCGWCKRMDAQTFSNPVIAEYVNENFYAVKFNAEQKEELVLGDKTYKFIDNGGRGYHEMAVILTRGRLSYPTLVYLDKDLKHLDVIPGYQNPEQLEVYLSYFNEGADKKTTIDKYAASFKGKLTASQ